MRMLKTWFIFLFVFMLFNAVFADVFADVKIPHTLKSFSKSKKLADKLYENHKITFYCRCTYNKKKVNPKSCGLTPRKNKKRANRIEWEHVIPAHAFGHMRKCWREKICTKKGKLYKGRRCCTKIDPVFKAMEADLHNLVPAVGELNGDRVNRSFSMVVGEPRVYGNCDFEIDYDTDKVEPMPSIRGNIARTYFYFERTYGLSISDKQRRLFDVWNKEDPVDDWERYRNCAIQRIQGNSNTFIQ